MRCADDSNQPRPYNCSFQLHPNAKVAAMDSDEDDGGESQEKQVMIVNCGKQLDVMKSLKTYIPSHAIELLV